MAGPCLGRGRQPRRPQRPYYQSECAAIYTESYNKLEAQGLVYPCFCSRAQLHAASAPHTSDGNVIYPGTCRGLTAEQIAEKRKKKAPAYRLMVPDEDITFTDGCMGPHTRTCSVTAAISTSAVPMACLPISWPWWWMMPGWGSRRWCGAQTCSLPPPGSSTSTACWG